MKRVTLFPGCLILYRFPEYESSALKVLKLLGYESKILSKTLCCGAYLEGLNANWFNFTVYNLALAEKSHAPVITLCGGCTNTFKRVQDRLESDPEFFKAANCKLEPLGLKISHQIEVKHIIQLLMEHEDDIKNQIIQPLSCKVAPVYPCQVYRPSSLIKNFDDPLKPHSLESLIALTGATTQMYSSIYECCSSSLYLNQPEASMSLGKRRIDEAHASEADFLLTACGNCHLLLNRLQSQYNSKLPLPVLFLTQFLGLSFGLSASEINLPHSILKGWIKHAN